MIDILPQLVVNSLITGSIYALASAGLAVTYGTLKILNFAHGHLMMIGAYIFYAFFVELNYSLFASTILSTGSVIAVGFISFTCFVRPFLGSNVLLPLVSTLALSAMIEAIISMSFGVNVKSLPLGEWGNSLSAHGMYVTPFQIAIIASAITCLGLLGVLIHKSLFGLRLIALAERPRAAESLGIARIRMTTIAFILGTLIAALAGIMVGFETNLQPTMGNNFTVKAFAAMVLGGLGNIWGTVLGSFLLGFVENFALGIDFNGWYLPAGYRDGFAFSIILFMLLFRPQGLLGSKARDV